MKNFLFITKYQSYFTYRTQFGAMGSQPFLDEKDFEKSLDNIKKLFKTDEVEIRGEN